MTTDATIQSEASPRISLGKQAEQIACQELTRKGYTLEALNWRAGRWGEIDIVALLPDRNLRVFVEVKCRRGASLEDALGAVNPRKQQKLMLVAEHYLAQEAMAGSDCNVRFDVVAVCWPGENRPARVCHVENAFVSS